MGDTPVKTAVIGAGYLGRFHAHKYASIEDAELVYCVDTDERRAEEVAGESGSKPCPRLRWLG